MNDGVVRVGQRGSTVETQHVAKRLVRVELVRIELIGHADHLQGALNPIINQADNTASFAYIIQVYDKPEQKTYTQAKGLVINDYQADLEAKWVAALKKKYPVKVNQKVWASILAGK